MAYIQKYRKLAGMTRQEVAERMGVQPPAVYKWENDIRSPTVRDLELLAKIYGVSPGTMFYDPDDSEAAESHEVWCRIAQVHPTAGFHINKDSERIDEAKELSKWINGFQKLSPMARRYITKMIDLFPIEGRNDLQDDDRERAE